MSVAAAAALPPEVASELAKIEAQLEAALNAELAPGARLGSAVAAASAATRLRARALVFRAACTMHTLVVENESNYEVPRLEIDGEQVLGLCNVLSVFGKTDAPICQYVWELAHHTTLECDANALASWSRGGIIKHLADGLAHMLQPAQKIAWVDVIDDLLRAASNIVRSELTAHALLEGAPTFVAGLVNVLRMHSRDYNVFGGALATTFRLLEHADANAGADEPASTAALVERLVCELNIGAALVGVTININKPLFGADGDAVAVEVFSVVNELLAFGNARTADKLLCASNAQGERLVDELVVLSNALATKELVSAEKFQAEHVQAEDQEEPGAIEVDEGSPRSPAQLLFKEGDKVEARFKRGEDHYPGEVLTARISKKGNALYKILYFDGDVENDVLGEFVRAAEPESEEEEEEEDDEDEPDAPFEMIDFSDAIIGSIKFLHLVTSGVNLALTKVVLPEALRAECFEAMKGGSAFDALIACAEFLALYDDDPDTLAENEKMGAVVLPALVFLITKAPQGRGLGDVGSAMTEYATGPYFVDVFEDLSKLSKLPRVAMHAKKIVAHLNGVVSPSGKLSIRESAATEAPAESGCCTVA